MLRLLRPHRVEGLGKVRLGRPNDGGYVMLDRFDGVTAAYSLGINDDVSWDLDIAARGIPTFQYNHTIERLPADHARSTGKGSASHGSPIRPAGWTAWPI